MATKDPGKPQRRSAGAMVKGVIVRGWALVLLAVVVWSGYVAFAYLIKVVFSPAHVPEAMTAWEGSLRVDDLEAESLGTSASAPRAPIGHYHGVDHWYQPDTLQTCTASGCHNMLPHVKTKASRAFANFHATFLTCQMCHEDRQKDAAQVQWIDLADGATSKPPALLRLIAWFEANGDMLAQAPEDAHAVVMPALTEAMGDMGKDALLEYLSVQLTTSQPGSPVWREAMDRLRDELPAHRRGEYNAKLAPIELYTDAYRSQQRDLIQRYQAAGPDGDKAVCDQLHTHVLVKPDACLSCHAQPARLDLRTLGYTQATVETLMSGPMIRMIQQNREGRPFYLPNLLEGE